MTTDYSIFPLGDSAAIIDLGNQISEDLNDKVIGMQQCLINNPFEGMKDVIIAYSSLTIYYDPMVIKKNYQMTNTVFEWVKEQLGLIYLNRAKPGMRSNAIISIPVCYDEDMGIDLRWIAGIKNLPIEKIIELHTAKPYRVYMIGFLPAFSYMGQVNERISVARKQKPVPVLAGSVGIAGAQTGIYPFNSPGGWNIIGRTPVKMFDANVEIPVKLVAGDQVQFYAISRNEFENGEWSMG